MYHYLHHLGNRQSLLLDCRMDSRPDHILDLVFEPFPFSTKILIVCDKNNRSGLVQELGPSRCWLTASIVPTQPCTSSGSPYVPFRDKHGEQRNLAINGNILQALFADRVCLVCVGKGPIMKKVTPRSSRQFIQAYLIAPAEVCQCCRCMVILKKQEYCYSNKNEPHVNN